jgi:hypothetical protein
MEDALIEVPTMRRFTRIGLISGRPHHLIRIAESINVMSAPM